MFGFFLLLMVTAVALAGLAAIHPRRPHNLPFDEPSKQDIEEMRKHFHDNPL